ncbi:TatD family hydrolase [Halobellus rubicundus]|uniref:TatD family hydrolase n=1 Tax=Halobellus rubicundus TaxID=2996466 RepID=A0ABD5M8J6_9EURY
MTTPQPTKRPTDAAYLDGDPDVPSELLSLPWIDPHNHAHTLSWNDRERYALAGCRAMLMIASGAHWTPYRPVAADDVRYLWDDAINRRAAIERNHFYEAKLGIGAPTRIRIEDPDALFDAMEAYVQLDEVAAVGETGITPSQHVSAWPLDEQRAAVGRQFEIAADADLPVVLHTPNKSIGPDRQYRDGMAVPGYEKNVALGADPVIDADTPALEAVRIDVEIAREVGLDEERIVASHADGNNLEFLLEETGCYASFTLGHSWMTGVTPADIADAIETYGPERIMVDTDCANILRSDPFSLKRAILELYRLGVDVEDIRRVVWKNPRSVLGLGDA